uniref:MARVEL domain-containing protein n=1 Tax=Angiostrongylus costaricensis TaxID=334426 RepID=A0A0R3PGC3_ANGCS
LLSGQLIDFLNILKFGDEQEIKKIPSASLNVSYFSLLFITTGSSLIAIFHIVVSSAVMYWAARSLATGNKSRIDAGFELVLSSFALVISLVLFAGLRCESRRVITVYIVVAISLLFILFLALIMGLKAGILDDADHNGYKTIEEEMLIVVEILCSFALVALEVWFLTVVLRSYRFITHKRQYFGVDREENL